MVATCFFIFSQLKLKKMKPTLQCIIAAFSMILFITSCNTEEPPEEEQDPLPTSSIEWLASSGGGVFDNFSQNTPTGGLTPVQFSISAVDSADADPAFVISIMEDIIPVAGKTYSMDGSTNIMNYTNLSFDVLDSYVSISGNLHVDSYEEVYSASGVTYFAMDGTFEGVLQDDDSPANVIEIEGQFTDVLFLDM